MIIKSSCTSCNQNEMSSLKFSPWKVSSSCPPTVWGIVQLGAQIPAIAVPTPNDKQGLFETKKKESWKKLGYFHLLSLVGQKACAAVPSSSFGQVRKGTQVFAFRVVPRTERERWWQWRFEHLSTFPWVPSKSFPPIVTKPSSQFSAQVPDPPFWRVNCDPPLIKQNHN